MKMNDDSRMVKDPICGKDVDTLRARAVAIFGGVTYYFCSFDCKAKFKDPRQVAPSEAVPPRETGERRGRDPGPLPEPPASSSSDQIRYAHSRMRRITGEVSTPVVQIDLSPSKPKPMDSGVRDVSTSGVREVADEALSPAKSSRAWAWVAIVMLIIAGGVILFTLKR